MTEDPISFEESGLLSSVDGLARTETARREARFKFARDRISKIASATPAFTPEQLAELARILTEPLTPEEFVEFTIMLHADSSDEWA